LIGSRKRLGAGLAACSIVGTCAGVIGCRTGLFFGDTARQGGLRLRQGGLEAAFTPASVRQKGILLAGHTEEALHVQGIGGG
jgi:hypothetical protein